MLSIYLIKRLNMVVSPAVMKLNSIITVCLNLQEQLRTVKEKLKQRESQLVAAEQNRRYLSDEIDTMKTVNQKLSQDLEVSLSSWTFYLKYLP